VDLLRVSRDAYGREVLQGMSWDLLWVFVAAGFALIVLHALYRLLLAPKQKRRSE
jgi:formate dehydrogenase subunit gamma